MIKQLGIAAAAVLVTAGPALLPVAAQARVIDGGHYHDVYVDNGIVDYCDDPDFPDLTVNRVQDFEGFYTLKTKAGGGLYSADHLWYTTTRTNPANGHTLTSVGHSYTKDSKVTDNGDGTLTIDVISNSQDVSYDQTGTIVDRSASSFQYSLVVDYAGTLEDTSDDQVIDFIFDKQVGHYADDWCGVVHRVLD